MIDQSRLNEKVGEACRLWQASDVDCLECSHLARYDDAVELFRSGQFACPQGSEPGAAESALAGMVLADAVGAGIALAVGALGSTAPMSAPIEMIKGEEQVNIRRLADRLPQLPGYVMVIHEKVAGALSTVRERGRFEGLRVVEQDGLPCRALVVRKPLLEPIPEGGPQGGAEEDEYWRLVDLLEGFPVAIAKVVRREIDSRRGHLLRPHSNCWRGLLLCPGAVKVGVGRVEIREQVQPTPHPVFEQMQEAHKPGIEYEWSISVAVSGAVPIGERNPSFDEVASQSGERLWESVTPEAVGRIFYISTPVDKKPPKTARARMQES